MTIYKKLFELQQKIGAISKDSENPFFKAKYFDINKLIEELKPHLNELKIVILQPLSILEGKNILKTVIALEGCVTTDPQGEGDAYLTSQIILPDNIDPQKMGSAITYYRRYALQSMLFLQAEDDDGESAKPKGAIVGGVKGPVPMGAYDQMVSTTAAPNTLFCCGSLMKHVKGVSKTTGKPYDFHACENCKKQVYPPKN